MKRWLKKLAQPLFREEFSQAKASEDRDNMRLEQLRFNSDEKEKLNRRLKATSVLLDEAKVRLQTEERSRANLEISNASLQRENEFAKEQMVRALENERYAVRLLANIQTQSLYGVKPYPDAPGLPDNMTADQPTQEQPVRMQGMDMVNRSRQEFMADARGRLARGESLPVPIEVLEASLYM